MNEPKGDKDMIDRSHLLTFTSCDDPDYTEPWTHEGFTYATDGAVLLKIPAIEGIGPHVGSKKASIIAEAINAYEKRVTLEPLPPLPPPDQWCEECEQWYYDHQPVCLGTTHIDAKYLFKLHTLPNCRISEPTEYKPIHFVFDGGCGWLMPFKLNETKEGL